MINKIQLPSFFVIGMQKSATTTLHHWLSAHEEVCLPVNKETHFFSNTSFYEKGIDCYLENFITMDSSFILGEVDPSYIFIDKSLDRIKKMISNPKFIIILRNPLERSYSHYCMNKYKGYENLRFIEAIESEECRINKNVDNMIKFSYLLRSCYSKQIKNLINRFPKSKILYIKFDDMINSNSQLNTYKKICQFLKISEKSDVNFSMMHNSRSIPKNIILRNFLYKNNSFKKFLKFIIPKNYQYKIKMKVDSYNKIREKKNEHDEINKLPEKYLKWSNNEVRKTMKMTNLNLTKWIYTNE